MLKRFKIYNITVLAVFFLSTYFRANEAVSLSSSLTPRISVTDDYFTSEHTSASGGVLSKEVEPGAWFKVAPKGAVYESKSNMFDNEKKPTPHKGNVLSEEGSTVHTSSEFIQKDYSNRASLSSLYRLVSFKKNDTNTEKGPHIVLFNSMCKKNGGETVSCDAPSGEHAVGSVPEDGPLDLRIGYTGVVKRVPVPHRAFERITHVITHHFE